MNTELPRSILDAIAHGRDIYHQILERPESVQYYKVEFDCSTLPYPVRTKGTTQEGLGTFWGGGQGQLNLDDHKVKNNACLYYFEIISCGSPLEVLDRYRHYRTKTATTQGRACPALRNTPPLNTNVLYVGKVKSNIGARIFVHLGYYHVGATAGLQLVDWTKDLGLKLQLHLYVFPETMRAFVDPLELPLARLLNPLIGKH